MTDRYAEGLRRPMGWSEAFQIAERGFKAWAEKEHNRKWFRRIDGTPIPNDLLVNIAQAFADASIPPDPPPMASEDEAKGLAAELRKMLEIRFRPTIHAQRDAIGVLVMNNSSAILSALSDRQILVEALEKADRLLAQHYVPELPERRAIRAALAKAKGAMIDCALSGPSS